MTEHIGSVRHNGVLSDLLAKAPRYHEAFLVPYSRDVGGGFQRRGGAVLAVIHDPDLLNLIDYLWQQADQQSVGSSGA